MPRPLTMCVERDSDCMLLEEELTNRSNRILMDSSVCGHSVEVEAACLRRRVRFIHVGRSMVEIVFERLPVERRESEAGTWQWRQDCLSTL